MGLQQKSGNVTSSLNHWLYHKKFHIIIPWDSQIRESQKKKKTTNPILYIRIVHSETEQSMKVNKVGSRTCRPWIIFNSLNVMYPTSKHYREKVVSVYRFLLFQEYKQWDATCWLMNTLKCFQFLPALLFIVTIRLYNIITLTSQSLTYVKNT